jgi:hypothetical protein
MENRFLLLNTTRKPKEETEDTCYKQASLCAGALDDAINKMNFQLFLCIKKALQGAFDIRWRRAP